MFTVLFTYIIPFIILIGFLVLAHEFGHFIVAKIMGVKVEEFAIGFPPRVWSIKKGETEYSLNAVPVGGYVRLFGEEYHEEDTGKLKEQGIDIHELRKRAFIYKKPWQKALILIAGVTMNFLVGWFIISVLFTQGLKVAPSSVTVEEVIEGSVAEQAGFEEGDTITAISFDDTNAELTELYRFVQLVEESQGHAVTFTVQHGEKERIISLSSDQNTPPIGATIFDVTSGSPADKVGVQGGDRVTRVDRGGDGVEVKDIESFIDAVKKYAGEEISITLMRNNREVTVDVVPRVNPPAGEGALGVSLQTWNLGVIPIAHEVKTYPWYVAPFAGLRESVSMTRTMVVELGRMIYKLVTFEQQNADVAGPAGIAKFTGEAWKQGLQEYLQFGAIISLNLAIMNLLPIPALDGGKLVFVGYEWITRKRIHQGFERYMNLIGFLLLLALLAIVTIFDIARFF